MARSEPSLPRRAALRLGLGAALWPLVACDDEDGWYGTDVSGLLPDLAFSMTRARDGVAVTEADYRGQAVALFFGYTFCPDICPMTLSNLAGVMEALGPGAQQVTILFVTVDPERDTPETTAEYVAAFTPRAEGLRGTDNQLARLARRFKVTYKVPPHAPGDTDYAVSHGKSVYVFDKTGAARVLWPQFDTLEADIDAAAGDLRRVIDL